MLSSGASAQIGEGLPHATLVRSVTHNHREA
jgi:hypothetical protein